MLGGLLNPAGGIDPTGGLDLDSPLGGDLVQVKPGQNSPDLTGAADNALPAADGRPAARTGLGDQPTNRTPADSTLSGGAAQRALPAADVVGEALPAPGGLPALGSLPVGNLLGGGLPLIGGLMPDGRTPSTLPAQESGLLGEGLPLLGGLGGLLPADSAQTLPAFDEAPDTSGMPAGAPASSADHHPSGRPTRPRHSGRARRGARATTTSGCTRSRSTTRPSKASGRSPTAARWPARTPSTSRRWPGCPLSPGGREPAADRHRDRHQDGQQRGDHVHRRRAQRRQQHQHRDHRVRDTTGPLWCGRMCSSHTKNR